MRSLISLLADAIVLSMLATALWRLIRFGDTETSKFWAGLWTVMAAFYWALFALGAADMALTAAGVPPA